MDSQTQTALILVVVGLLLFGGVQAWGGGPDASPGEITLLAQLIDAEARGESYRGKVAVGAVVVNRVKSDEFPDTLRAVIYQPNQFATEAMRTHVAPSDESMRAARAALSGEDPTGGALYFYNPRTANLSDWWRTRTPLTQIGNHVFLR